MKYLFLFLIFNSNFAFANKCSNLFECDSVCMASNISREVAKNVEKKVSLRGYAILIGAMVGSAAITAKLTSMLPTHAQFLSQLVAQISTLGIFVLGSPIWEPITSGFRKFAFGINKNHEESNTDQKQLETLWLKTQENYSLNAQMSRNIINLFIASTRQNFYEAHRAFTEHNKEYSADQIAEAAVRLKMLFKEIPPNDPSVAIAIQTAFTNHLQIDDAFKKLVFEKIKKMHISDDFDEEYYFFLLQNWLKK